MKASALALRTTERLPGIDQGQEEGEEFRRGEGDRLPVLERFMGAGEPIFDVETAVGGMLWSVHGAGSGDRNYEPKILPGLFFNCLPF